MSDFAFIVEFDKVEKNEHVKSSLNNILLKFSAISSLWMVN